MANVKNVRLSVGAGAGGKDRATIVYDIEFSEIERQLNIAFDEIVILVDRDAALDSYLLAADDPYGIKMLSLGGDHDEDEYAGQIYAGIIRPDNNASIARNHTKDWNFPDNENGPEEYRALVTVIPQLRRGMAWSNEVSSNRA